MRKRIISLLMVLCLSMSIIAVPVKADAGKYEGVITALRSVEPFKEDFGFAGVDFSKIEIGDEIKVYNYENGTFIESKIAFPLFYEDELISILYNVGNGHYQPMPEMHTLIEEEGCANVAIVYDRMGCHVYDGSSFTQILQSENEILSRDVLTDDVVVMPNTIEITDLSVHYDLEYTSDTTAYGINPRTEYEAEYVYLPVAHVSQGNYSNLCWAASIACIVNYKLGTNYDVEYIATQAFGYVSNERKEMSSAIIELKKYCPQYQHIDYLPTTDRIKTNLRNSNPVYGGFDGWGTRHASVIYGFNESESYYIHDPMYGSMIGYLIQGVVSYYIPADNIEINLYQGLVVN